MTENHGGAAAAFGERKFSVASAVSAAFTYEIYTDGSAAVGAVAPGAVAEGPCGWAYVIVRSDGRTRTASGGIPLATNNRAELTAVIEALSFLPDDRVGVVRSDSQYVIHGMTTWRPGWIVRNFSKVKNSGLWRCLYALADARPAVSYEWTKGHAGNRWNNVADRLAKRAATQQAA